MYSSYQIVIENEPECVNLQEIPILYMNSIALQFKDEQMTEFKVIEFALIILSLLISMICGARYLIVSMTYMCQTTINILALLSLILMILPSITLCSKTFKMSFHMQRIIQLLYLLLLILGITEFFFFLNSNLQRMQIVRENNSRRSWSIAIPNRNSLLFNEFCVCKLLALCHCLILQQRITNQNVNSAKDNEYNSTNNLILYYILQTWDVQLHLNNSVSRKP
ncbi:unnamed protein product [Paramecium pentaurelia]|uniref:Uncharacterized protein n=1 Tax=Paramecium pentaurelia TaxID=43138 RepID=A0A8S1XV78_9CILI|nr:unnamed protein product [Paramecium pentaurelia]